MGAYFSSGKEFRCAVFSNERRKDSTVNIMFVELGDEIDSSVNAEGKSISQRQPGGFLISGVRVTG